MILSPLPAFRNVQGTLCALPQEAHRSGGGGGGGGDLVLITGAGHHSAAGATPLRDSVRRLLTDLHLPFTAGDAAPASPPPGPLPLLQSTLLVILI